MATTSLGLNLTDSGSLLNSSVNNSNLQIINDEIEALKSSIGENMEVKFNADNLY